MFVDDGMVNGIQIIQPFQRFVLFEVDDRSRLHSGGGYMIFQSVHNLTHLREVGETLELPQNFHGFRHRFQVLFVQRGLCDAVFRVFVLVILVFVYHNRCVITQLLAAHHLYIHLYGTFADSLVDSFIFVKGIRAGIYQVFQCPATIRITQTVINRFITNQGISIDRHRRKYKDFLQK